MIVFYHSDPNFGKYDPFIVLGKGKGQAVSFFFVLSGFILSYVYPNLNSFGDVRRFLVARFARIWPGHIFAFLLVLLLIPHDSWIGVTGSTTHGIRKALANICMVHAWIPKRGYFFAFNSPSWSISTEFFFYLCFPLLIYQWKRQWKIKLAGVFLLAFSMFLLAQLRHYPPDGPLNQGISTEAIVYIHPFSRLLEFTLGMTMFLAWEKLRKVPISRVVGTGLELASIGAALSVSYWIAQHSSSIEANKWIGKAGGIWFLESGNQSFFAVLVLIMALEKGFISRILSLPFVVTLGEISFSVYLIHGILLWFYYLHAPVFSMLPDGLVYGVYWLLLLVMSHLVWQLVERPARKRLVELFAKTSAAGADSNAAIPHEDPAGRPIRSSKIGFLFTRRWLVAELLLLSSLIMVIAVHIHNPHSFCSIGHFCNQF